MDTTDGATPYLDPRQLVLPGVEAPGPNADTRQTPLTPRPTPGYTSSAEGSLRSAGPVLHELAALGVGDTDRPDSPV